VQTQQQVQGGLFLDIVVGQGVEANISSAGWWDAFLFLDHY